MSRSNTRRGVMNLKCKKSVAFGFVFGFLLGSALAMYLKLWTVDSTLSSRDMELLRKEFDRTNMEAMDESAEWRMMYDSQVKRTRQCKEELERNSEKNAFIHSQLKATFASATSKLDAQQKGNILVGNNMESQCICNQSTTV